GIMDALQDAPLLATLVAGAPSDLLAVKAWADKAHNASLKPDARADAGQQMRDIARAALEQSAIMPSRPQMESPVQAMPPTTSQNVEIPNPSSVFLPQAPATQI